MLLTVIIGTAVALIASLTPIGKLEEMVNIGTLAAFTLVSISVPILRRRRPVLHRTFKVPFNPVLPILPALICVYLMLNLSVETGLRFLVWMALGLIIYFAYSRRHSLLETGEKFEEGEVPSKVAASSDSDMGQALRQETTRHPAPGGRRGSARPCRESAPAPCLSR